MPSAASELIGCRRPRLTGYELNILADHDEDGLNLAAQAQSLLAKVAKSTRIVPFPHLWKHLAPEHASTQPSCQRSAASCPPMAR